MEDQAPYLTTSTPRRYVALGKVAGLWHVVTRGADGRQLLPLTPRRRRAFTPAELAHAERFPSKKGAADAGAACGLERTYATPEPPGQMPTPAELARRRILQRMEPRDTGEVARLSAYVASHPEDHAALLSLTPSQLVLGTMLQQMREFEALKRVSRTTTAADLADRAKGVQHSIVQSLSE